MSDFDIDTLLVQASAQCGGLKDFGDDSFRPALQALLTALDGEAKLSPMGRQLLRQRIVEMLVNRLRVEDYCKRNPEILDEEIAQPVVIVGLPRTGTTLLQRILACDPRFYSLAWWESRYPVPPADGNDTRIAEAKVDVRMMIEAMPQLLSIHPLDAEQADEEVMLMEHSFYGAMEAYAHIPAYVAWREAQDKAPAYRYLKKLLQFVQWQKKQRGIQAQRWILKTPHHLHAMDALFAVFSDVRVIQTHRDPLQTVPSLASFVHTLWRIYSEQADAGAVGRQWNHQFAHSLRSTMQFRERLQEQRFLDVQFIDTVRQPMEVVREIYAFLDVPLDASVERAMQQWLQQNGRDRRAVHGYTAEQFGLSEVQLRRDYAAYRERYIEAAT
ncbi:MAG TPA: sulfotransferase [Noviherbaspirillum sp.]|nr:sulfotransferase [Noviherbaspirillum sp.]